MTVSTPCCRDELFDQRGIGYIAFDEGGPLAHLGAHASRKIVQHDDVVAAIQQRIDSVAADIAGASGNQNRHLADPPCFG